MQAPAAASLGARRGRAARLAGLALPSRPHLVGIAAVTLFVVFWQSIVWLGWLRPAFASSPLEVLGVTLHLVLSGEMGTYLLVSAFECFAGLAPAVLGGVSLGFSLGQSRRLRHLIDPTLMALYATPRIALLPLLVIWYGIGMESKILLAFLGALFPIVVNVEAGVRHVQLSWIRAARSFGATRRQVALKVLLPATSPWLIGGVRLGVGRAVLSVVAGEMYVATMGLGYLIQQYGNAGRTPEVMSLAMVTALVGFACVTALSAWEARSAAWHESGP